MPILLFIFFLRIAEIIVFPEVTVPGCILLPYSWVLYLIMHYSRAFPKQKIGPGLGFGVVIVFRHRLRVFAWRHVVCTTYCPAYIAYLLSTERGAQFLSWTRRHYHTHVGRAESTVLFLRGSQSSERHTTAKLWCKGQSLLFKKTRCTQNWFSTRTWK